MPKKTTILEKDFGSINLLEDDIIELQNELKLTLDEVTNCIKYHPSLPTESVLKRSSKEYYKTSVVTHT